MNTIATTDSKKPNTKQELITANIKLLIEQLDAGYSEALTNYLTAMSRFHQYSFGNVLEIARQMPTATRYSKGSKILGIQAGEYARVTASDRGTNTVTVKRRGGEGVSYDPRRL